MQPSAEMNNLPNPCVDCVDLEGGLSRMRHGGHYFYGPSLLISYVQYSNLPAEVSSTNGVRCARSIPPVQE